MSTRRVPASLVRRLGAAFYDLLVVIALWMVVYFPLVALGWVGGSLDDSHHPLHLALRFSIAFVYLGWCWTHGGATLGALAWKVEVTRIDGAALSWRDAARRFGLALGYLVPFALFELSLPHTESYTLYYLALLGPFVVGVLASRFDRDGRALHERAIATRLVARPATAMPV